MTLHLIKLSVGTEDVEDLRAWHEERLRKTGAVYHQTRMCPRRKAELLDGGSIYWVIKGVILCRQRLLDIVPTVDGEGRPCVRLMLDPELVRTEPRAHRPFQGWRYLAPEDAPADLESLGAGAGDLPAEMVAELRALGLL
jgi:hypothetical protein